MNKLWPERSLNFENKQTKLRIATCWSNGCQSIIQWMVSSRRQQPSDRKAITSCYSQQKRYKQTNELLIWVSNEDSFRRIRRSLRNFLKEKLMTFAVKLIEFVFSRTYVTMCYDISTNCRSTKSTRSMSSTIRGQFFKDF